MILIILQLRCSGQRSGCDRCKAVGYPCVYSPAAHSRDGRKVNKRSTPAGRGGTKQHRFIKYTEKAGSHQALPTRNYRDGYKHSLAPSLNQEAGKEHEREQQKRSQQGIQDVAENNIHEVSTEELSPMLNGFRGELKTLHEPQIPTTFDFLDYPMSAGVPWASSFSAAIGDTYFAHPVGTSYNAFDCDNTTCGNVFASLPVSSPPLDVFMQLEPVVLASTDSSLNTTI